MPVVINAIETEISVTGDPPAGAAAPSEAAPLEVQVEELRAAIRAIIQEELERALRRRLPER
jgi:hypothetical protein